MTYRDSLAGLRSQVAVKRAALDAREREVTSVLRALLPAEIVATIAELRDRAVVDGASLETLDALSDVDAALDGILAAYESALAIAPQLRACADDPGDPPAPEMPQPWLIEEPTDLSFRAGVDARLSFVAGDERLARWGDRGYVARVAIPGVRCLYFAKIADSEEDARFYECTLRITIPKSLGPLALSTESALQRFGQAIGLARELETGDAAFDRAFWIQGAASAAALLTPNVRKALLALPGRSPELLVEGGFATLEWTVEWRGDGFDALPASAIDVVRGIREAVASG